MVGGLGAASAALAGYVSRTFVKSQDAAAGHLRAYFEQPLVSRGTWPLSGCCRTAA